MKDLFTDWGLEIEVEDVTSRVLENVKTSAFDISIHGDASCEGYSNFLGSYKVSEYPDSLQKYVKKTKVGFELVTSIIKSNEGDILKDLIKITQALASAGESAQSFRAGIHVHINMGTNLKILKKIIELGSHLEQVFFLLGGMGYEYRGSKNDSTYCRPITKFGPPCVKTRRGFAQCFTVGELLESNNSTEFGEKYGDIFNQGGNRYFPVRYTWLNLSNLFSERRGSLEFRIFNKSLNPEKIFAIMEFCRLFSQSTILESIKPSKLEWEMNSIYDIKDKESVIATFNEFLETMGLDLETKTQNILIAIMNQTPLESVIHEKQYIYSHLMHLTRGDQTSQHWSGRTKYNPELIGTSQIAVPKFVDIHVLDNQENNSPGVSGSRPSAFTFNTIRPGRISR